MTRLNQLRHRKRLLANGCGASPLVWTFHTKLVLLSAYSVRNSLDFDRQLFVPYIWKLEAINA